MLDEWAKGGTMVRQGQNLCGHLRCDKEPLTTSSACWEKSVTAAETLFAGAS
jgi:hypothetical protein